MEPFALTISQAAELGRPCRSALYQDIRDGRLRAVKRGRSTRILVDDFRWYLANLPTMRAVAKPAVDAPSEEQGGRRRGRRK
jgi:excisionase family DNA binding protein